jgi:hypothetical protein
MQLFRFLKYSFCTVLFTFIVKDLLSGQICKTINTTFNSGEELTYVVSYNWFIVWADVGEIKLEIKDAEFKNKSAYHITGAGKTYKNWDWFFKVRDQYESYLDAETLKPAYFKRDIHEGGYNQLTTYNFNFADNRVYSQNKVNNNPLKSDTVVISNCTFDIMSAVYYSRNLDLNLIKIGDTIPMTIILDQELYNIYFNYAAVENIKIANIGTIECNKFIISLVKGADFAEGSNMTLWATKDGNRLPVYVESPLVVGKVKVMITEIKGNRYPFTFIKKTKTAMEN